MDEYVKRCLARRLALVPGSAFTPVPGAPCNSVGMSYSTENDERIERGCRIMGDVAREMLDE